MIVKVEFEKQELVQAIYIVIRAIPSKSTMELLECIAISATETEIKLTTNNLELGIESYVNGSIQECGTIAINARLFSEIIRRLPDDTIHLETTSEHNATLRCDSVEISLPYILADDFPILPSIQPQNEIKLSQLTLKNIIKQTVFSISENDTRKMMTGELLKCNHDKLVLASLDSYRLSLRHISLAQDYTPFQAIIPGKTLIEISKILSDNLEDTVCIQVTEKHILFQMQSSRIVSRLIEGDFYHVDKLITKDYTSKITLNKRALIECLDRASLLISEREKKPIRLHMDGTSLKLTAKSNLGAINEVIPMKKEGADLCISFHPKYLMDALRVIDDELVTMYFNGKKMPCIIRDVNSTYIYLISPLADQE